MTYCSYCDLVHGEEHRFCQVCGQLLKRSHAGVRPCSRCGAHTLPGQKFCTDCGLPLRVMPAGREEEATPRSPLFYPRGPEPRPSRPSGRRRRPLLAALGVVLLLGAGWGFYWAGKKVVHFVSQTWSGSPTQDLPATPATDTMKPDVEKLAEKIRAAHLNKDINKWLGCYASTYPKLGQLENSILEMWKNHDIKEVAYRISNVQRLGPRQASAIIVWNFQLYDHRNHDYQLLRQTYRITLEKANGDWKIKESREDVEPKA